MNKKTDKAGWFRTVVFITAIIEYGGIGIWFILIVISSFSTDMLYLLPAIPLGLIAFSGILGASIVYGLARKLSDDVVTAGTWGILTAVAAPLTAFAWEVLWYKVGLKLFPPSGPPNFLPDIIGILLAELVVTPILILSLERRLRVRAINNTFV